MTSNESIRTFLSSELERRVRNNPRYSLRAFARQLKLSPGELSEILRGVRPVSVKAALKIGRALGLSEGETRKLVHWAGAEAAGIAPGILADGPSPEEGPRSPFELNLDLFRIVSDWYCFAILNLAATRGAVLNARYISKRLAITVTEAKFALERLERVGLVEADASGALRVTKDFVFSPSGVPSEAIRNFHRAMLEKAIDALEEQSIEERDITGTGMAIDPKDLPKIRKDISDFQDRLAAKYSKGKPTEVYFLETAFFRLTQRGDLS